MTLVKNNMQESRFTVCRIPPPAGFKPSTANEMKKVFSLKLKQYDEIFHTYDQINMCGSRKNTHSLNSLLM